MRLADGARFVTALARDVGHAVREKVSGRRVWERAGRAHIEARGVHAVDTPDVYVAALERELGAVAGVRWAAVNGVLGDVVVDFDPERVDAAELRRVVARVEDDHGMSGVGRDGVMHPGDPEPLLDELLELGGDVMGAVVGTFGSRLAPVFAAPAEAMSALAVFDLFPKLRQGIEDRIGRHRTELVLSLAGAVLGAAAQTPVSALADASLRAVELPAALARRRVWRDRSVELASRRLLAKAEPLAPPGPRPTALPDGPVEEYARKARRAAGVVAGVLLPVAGPLVAARAVAIAAPKAARMSVDAYAAELGRILASRGAVVRDPGPLRVLDRVDTVVLDASALTTGRYAVAEVIAADDTVDAETARQRAQRILDPRRPYRRIVDGGWTLARLTELDTVTEPGLVDRARRSGRRPGEVLALAENGRLVALVTVEAELDPLAGAVFAAAREVGTVLTTPISSGLAQRLGADGAVAGGSRLTASLRTLRQDGHAVMLVSGRGDAALAAADFGAGVIRTEQRPPWAAHLLTGPGLAEVCLILRAAVSARKNSERGVRLAMLGAGAGALVSLLGSGPNAGRRGLVPVSAAAIVGIGASVWSVNRLASQPAPVATDSRAWHAMPVDQALRELRTVLTGLTFEQARDRRGDVAAARTEETLLSATVSELDTPLTVPLAAGAGVSAASGSPLDAGLVAVVMVGNAVLGAMQRIAASRAVTRLSDIGALRARLRRDGGERIAPATELVGGDIVVLRSGDVVPADCRLLESSNLEMDESSLTGESLPVAKDPAPVFAASVADRSSMVYAGTTVAAGTGVATVVSTGQSTEAERGAVAAEALGSGDGVQSRLHRLTAASIPVAVAAAVGVLGIGLLRGRFADSISTAVALAVAAVPEGLPFVATVAQLAAARRLSRREVLVKAPRTLEALGRVNVVCFDKTGTLTQGRIELRRVCDGDRDEPLATLSGHRLSVLAAALRASPIGTGDDQLPHPTDRAVVTGGTDCDLARDHGLPGWRMVRELPFEPGRGFHAVLGRTDDRHVISVKGAPETVLPRCVGLRDGTGARALSDTDHDVITAQVTRLARGGYRVLAVAERSASSRAELDVDRVARLEFLGLLCLADTIRPTAAAAIRRLRGAGIDVVMLTGDHPSTAEAIATELDLRTTERVVTGADIDATDHSRLAELAAEAAVFARVSPAHKVAIVRALQQRNLTVAVTGDGANDAPAIRLADVGIALGSDCAPATRQAADLIITDDRIETIADAVIESRAMWRSVRDSVAFLLGGNLGEIGFTLGASLLSHRPPLNARQLLLVNLLTDLVPALVIAARPPRGVTPEELVDEGPDAAVGDPLTREVSIRAVTTAAGATAGWLAARLTGTPGRASTVAFASLVATQLAQITLSTRDDPVVLTAVIGSLAALVALVQFPPTSLFFGCRPLGPVGWTISFASAVAATFAAVVITRRLDALTAAGQPTQR